MKRVILCILPAVALLAGCLSSNDEQSLIEGENDSPSVRATATHTPMPATPSATNTPRNTPTPRPTATPTPIPPRISVADPEFVYYTNSLGDLIGGWWADVTNESADRVALVRVQGIFYDGAGVILGTDTIYIDALFPGQTLRAVDDYVSLSGVPARIETRIERQDFTVAQTTSILTVEDLEYTPGRFSSSIRGIVVSPYTTNLQNVELGCLARDIEGTVVAVATGRVDLLPGGARAVGECSLHSNYDLSTLYSVEMHPSVGILTTIVD